MPASSRSLLTSLLILTGFLVPSTLAAQSVATVSADQENLRQDPQGTRLASVMQGTEMTVLEEQDQWRQVRLEGWIWAPSVRSTNRNGYDLEVSADGGENLRATPNGEIRARAREGMLFTRLGRQGNWFRVQREAWMWAPSLDIRQVQEAGEGQGGDSSGGSGEGGSTEESGEAPAREHVVVGERPVRLHTTARGGDSTATIYPGSDLEVLARKGEWTRVRMDGWVRAPSLVSPDSAGVESDLTAAELRQNPEKYQGRRVRWTVQFVALRRAEAIRTDFYEGEPFVLARPPGSSEGFVYLAVPPELLSEAQDLKALQSIEVLARVRTGSSSLMGVPILDLLAIY